MPSKATSSDKLAGQLMLVCAIAFSIAFATILLAHIFERFVDSPRGRSRTGLGLGLPLAQGLVALHGGTIEAASPGKGQGATFTVRLPGAAARRGARGAVRG